MRSIGSLMKKNILPSQLVGRSMSGRRDAKAVMIALCQESGTPAGVRVRRYNGFGKGDVSGGGHGVSS